LFQVVTTWGLSGKKDAGDFKVSEGLRGYEKGMLLTGQFSNAIRDEKISPLSVSDISNKYCPTGRDRYFEKGLNKLPGARNLSGMPTWERRAGSLTENYVIELWNARNRGNVKRLNRLNYSELISNCNSYTTRFNRNKASYIKKLKALELGSDDGKTEWLLNILNELSKNELALQLLDLNLGRGNTLSAGDLKFKEKLKPDTNAIGISKEAEPDFLIEKFKLVGDIKTSTKPFNDIYELEAYRFTCAGYALAYENQTGKDVNWGAIYFLQMLISNYYERPLIAPQVYIFPIDDTLRTNFRRARSDLYSKLSENTLPPFPEDKRNCKSCRFLKECVARGLKV
jgi:CRISPR/Cas system-associated exonuclease Cas4 (RecB family)